MSTRVRPSRFAALFREEREWIDGLRAWWKGWAGSERRGSAETAGVLCTFIVAFASAAMRAVNAGDRGALELAGVVALGAAAFGALSIARHLRGRIALVDVIHPLVWLVPWQIFAIGARELIAMLGATVLVLGLTCGWSPLGIGLRRSTRWLAARFDQRTIGLLLLILAVWLPHLELPSRTEEPNLDSSWREVKGYELAHHWQAGKDIVFTFGPLGYFQPAPYIRELFWTQVVWWEIAFKLVLTSVLVLAARRTGGPIEKTVYLLVLLFLFPGQDSVFFTMSVAISLRILDTPRPSRPSVALGFLCLALISLVKFTYFALIGACVALIALDRAFAVSWRSGVRTLLSYALIFATVWMLIGQSLLHFPSYVLSSWWIARGYNEGMTWVGPGREVLLAYWIMSLVGLIGLLHVLQRPRNKTAWISAVVVFTGAFVSMKAGLVRHGGNSITFFGCTAAVTFLLPAFEARDRRERVLRGLQAFARISCAVLSAYGYTLIFGFGSEAPGYLVARASGDLGAHASKLAILPEHRARLDNFRHVMMELAALPEIRAAVGHEPVDVFGSAQVMALFNDLNYRPRPVFQSYSAYTPELMELNARFLSGDHAPRFLIFRYECLDSRLPCSEDGLALQVMMRDYAPVLSEKGFLLLERSSDRRSASQDARRVVLETTIDIGQTLDLEPVYAADRMREAGAGARGALDHDARRGPYLLALEVHSTFLGRLKSALSKGTPLFINCTLGSGNLSTYHAIPGMVSSGVIVNPLLDSQDAWLGWYFGDSLERISKFRLSVHAGAERFFEPHVKVRVIRDDTLSPRPLSKAAAWKLKYPMCSLAPEYARANPAPGHVKVDSQEVLLMPAPSEMCFRVEPGRHSIRARYGLIPDAFEKGASDGAGFWIVARDAAGVEKPLAHRLIERRTTARGSMHKFALEYEARTPVEILFRIDPGPQEDMICDWTYWTGISITDASPETAAK